MTDIERLEERLAAVERTVVDGDHEVGDLADVATLTEEVERLADRLDDLERRLADLEGDTQALQGYVGQVQSVNDEVERRATAAFAAVDRLEDRVDTLEATTNAETIDRLDEQVTAMAERLDEHERQLAAASAAQDGEHEFVFDDGTGLNGHDPTPAANGHGDATTNGHGPAPAPDDGAETVTAPRSQSLSTNGQATNGQATNGPELAGPAPTEEGPATDHDAPDQEEVDDLFGSDDAGESDDDASDGADDASGLLARLKRAFS